jgi:hypothetical protein
MSKHAGIATLSRTHAAVVKASWLGRKTNSPMLDQAADFDFSHISRLALTIESDRSQVEEWYRADRIRELGGLTARQLVRQGNADLVINFLRSIRRGERD